MVPMIKFESREDRLKNTDYLKTTTHELFFVLSTMLTQVFNQASAMMGIVMAQRVFERYSDAAHSQANWLMSAFSLACGAFVLISGRLGDVYGLRMVMFCGYAWLILWSLLSGLSYYTNINFHIVCRALQGMGIAFVIPNMMGIVGSIYKPNTKAKDMAFSLIAACAPLGAFLGGLFTGLIAKKTPRFDWCYYAYAIAATCAAIFTYLNIPGNLPVNPHNHSMDWMGAFLGVVSLVLFSFVWNQAGTSGWDTAYLIALLCVAVVAHVLFWVWEVKFAASPLIPHSLSRHAIRLCSVLLAVLFGWGSFGAWTYYYFEFSHNLRGFSPLQTGVSWWPLLISGISASVMLGFVFKILRTELILFLSMCAFMAPCIMLCVTRVEETFYRNTLGMLVILGFAMDWSYPAASICLSDYLPADCQGMAGSLANTVTNYGMSLFLGMATTVQRYAPNTEGLSEKDALLKGYRAGLYFGIGIAVLAVGLTGISLIVSFYGSDKEVNIHSVESFEDKSVESVPGHDYQVPYKKPQMGAQ